MISIEEYQNECKMFFYEDIISQEIDLGLGLLCFFESGFWGGEFCHTIDIIKDDDEQYLGVLLIR